MDLHETLKLRWPLCFLIEEILGVLPKKGEGCKLEKVVVVEEEIVLVV